MIASIFVWALCTFVLGMYVGAARGRREREAMQSRAQRAERQLARAQRLARQWLRHRELTRALEGHAS